MYMPPKRKRPTTEYVPESSILLSTKRAKASRQKAVKAAPARHAPTAIYNTSQVLATEASLPAPRLAKSDLIPTIPRRNAVLGQRNESLLRLPCTNTKTGKDIEQHFQKRNASEIDWNNQRHIEDINNWSNQIYTRAALYVKKVDVWLPDEEAWMELYFHLSIAETRKRGIRQPRIKDIWQAFLQFFGDRALTSKDGEIVTRKPRTSSAFSAKFRRFEELAERLRQCMRGKSGDLFMPDINDAMLERFKEMKEEMAAKGLKKESAYAGESLQDWLAFFSHLPTHGYIDDVETDGEEEQLEDSGVAFGAVEEDIDAAATLISLASQPNGIRLPARARRKRKTEYQGIDPAMHSNWPTHSIARVTQDSAVEGPSTPHSPSITKGVLSRKTKLLAHAVYSDSD
ncbi:hypothetical protein N0V95_000671 [Ascochyta clinopodiicola]|nr:hypothetical protein N0V95_000671 [Ascochyta clinopodiicola]